MGYFESKDIVLLEKATLRFEEMKDREANILIQDSSKIVANYLMPDGSYIYHSGDEYREGKLLNEFVKVEDLLERGKYSNEIYYEIFQFKGRFKNIEKAALQKYPNGGNTSEIIEFILHLIEREVENYKWEII